MTTLSFMLLRQSSDEYNCILYVKEFLQLYSPEDCLNNMKLRVVNYWNSFIFPSTKEGEVWGPCTLFFWNCILPGMCCGKFAFVSLPKSSETFWSRHSPNFVVGLYVVWQNSYNLARSGYGYFDFPLTHISS